MFVAATTDCFPTLTLEEAVEKLADLEFVNLEICIDEKGDQLTPAEVAENVSAAVVKCGATRRLNLTGFLFRENLNHPNYYDHFDAICNLAKLSRVVTLTVESAELGTPFNEEVERLKQLVAIAENHGVRVGVRGQHGCLSEDPDTISVICEHVKGLGLAYDPSHYLYQAPANRNTDKIIQYTSNVYLRDTTPDALQVQVGHGEIDYGRIIDRLTKIGYRRGLCVDIQPDPELDHFAELRKLRMLLESFLMT